MRLSLLLCDAFKGSHVPEFSRFMTSRSRYTLNVRSGKWPPKGRAFANNVRLWEYTSRVQMKVSMR